MMYSDKRFLLLEEVVIPKTQQLTTDTIEMQSSPAYESGQHKVIHCTQYMRLSNTAMMLMDTNSAYVTHKNT